MKLVTFVAGGREAAGCVDDDETTVRDLTPLVGDATLLDLVEDWDRQGPRLAAAADLPVVDDARLRAPFPAPRRDLFAAQFPERGQHRHEEQLAFQEGAGVAQPVLGSTPTEEKSRRLRLQFVQRMPTVQMSP